MIESPLLSRVDLDPVSISSLLPKLAGFSDGSRELDEGGMNFFIVYVFDKTGGETIVVMAGLPKHSPDKNWLRGIVRSSSTSFEAKNKLLPSQRGKVTLPLAKLRDQS